MPLVPFQTDVNAPLRGNAAYKPALDNLRRPRVSADNVVSGMRQLGQAVKADTVDPSSFERSAGALGAIGEAVMRAGGVGLALVDKHKEAKERKALLEIDLAKDIANASIAAFKDKNPNNTAAWVKETDRVTSELLSRWKDDERLGKAAKEELALKLNTWRKVSMIGAETDMVKADFASVKQGYLTRGNDLRRMGRVEEAKALEPGMKNSGVFEPYELEHESTLNLMASADEAVKQLNAESARLASMGDYAGAKALIGGAQKPEAMNEGQWQSSKEGALRGLDKQQQQQDANMLLNDDPKLLQEMLAMPGKFDAYSPQERSDLKAKADSARERAAQMQVQDAKRALDLLPTDKLKDAKSDALGVEVDQLTPWHRQLVEQDIAIRQGKASLDDEGQYLEDLSQVERYDPEKDPQGIVAARAEQVFDVRYSKGGSYHKRLMDKLNAKLNPGEETPDFAAAKASVFESAEQASMVPETEDGRQVVRKAEQKLVAGEGRVSGVPNVARWLTAPFGGLLLPPAQYGPDGTVDKIKENNGNPVPLQKRDEALLKVNNAKAKAVAEKFEREYQTNKAKWDTDPALMEKRKKELLREAGLPVVPSNRHAGLNHTDILLPKLSAEDLAKGTK